MIIPFNPPLAPSPLPFLFPGDEAADQVGSRSACPRESRESLNASFSPRQEDGAAEKRQRVMVGGGRKGAGKNSGVAWEMWGGGKCCGANCTRDREMCSQPGDAGHISAQTDRQ